MVQTKKKNPIRDFATAVAFCTYSRLLRPFVRRGAPFLACFVVEDTDQYGFHEIALGLLLGSDQEFGMRRAGQRLGIQKVYHGKIKFPQLLADAQQYPQMVFIFERESDVPEVLRNAADAFAVIGKTPQSILKAAVYKLYRHRISDTTAELMSQLSWQELATCFRLGHTPHSAINKLRRVQESMSRSKPSQAVKSDSMENGVHKLGLEHLHGYGDLVPWGLQLKEDFDDFRAQRISWRDIDRGVLISGPPGVGKTRFAEALAVSCRVPLFTASYAEWQKAGHMGDQLREMRATFANAQKCELAVILVDEVDSFGSRAEDGELGRYMTAVMNAFLESLDGAVQRQGVVVIGTTNFPERVDPALLRSGRLDRHFTISLPDAAARWKILAQYLGSDLDPDAAALLNRRTEGMSGADLELVARDARRLARKRRETLNASHVLAALPEVLLIPPDRLRISAVHESGHAVVAVSLGRQIDYARVADHIRRGPKTHELGGVSVKSPGVPRRTLSHYLEEITILFAGMAAEQQRFGGHDDGVGGGHTSDLVQATHFATLVEAYFGMGDNFSSEEYRDNAEIARRRHLDPLLAKRVEAILKEQFGRALAIVREHKDAIDGLADRLVEVKRMDGPAVMDFLKSTSVGAAADPRSSEGPEEGLEPA